MSSLRDNVYKKATDFPKVKLGISSCLLGDNVRFNGGHVKDRFLADSLGRYVDWVPVCPEVEIGMGVPRENIRLVGDPDKPKLIAPKSGTDYTYQMESWAKHRVEQLKELGLHGYVLKSDSPSCGLSRVRVYGKSSVPVRKGTGVFARELSGNVTAIALEEEGRLKDYRIRENFVERIFTYQRWNETVMDNPTPAKLVSFHTRHKCILMAHNQRNQTQLGRLVATAGTRDISDVVYEYEELLVQTMNLIATNKKNMVQTNMACCKEN